MQKIFALIFFTLIFTSACKRNNLIAVEKSPYYLNGEIIDTVKIDKLLAFIISDSCNFHIDTIDVVDGKFLLKDYSDTLNQINLYYKENKYLPIYLQKTDSSIVKIYADKDSCHFENDTVNSAFYDFMYANRNSINKITGETEFSDSLKIKVKQTISNFISNNIDNIASTLILKEFLVQSYDSLYVKKEIESIKKIAKPGLLLSQINTFNKIASTPQFDRRIPTLSVVDTAKVRFNINDLSDSYSVITFWASWDSVSVSRVKELNKLSKDFKNKALSFVSISLDTNDSIWQENVAKFKIPGRNYRLRLGFADDNAVRYGVRSLPTNYIADKRIYLIKENIFGSELSTYLKKVVEDKKKENKANKPKPNPKK
ncbi:MAG: TlpA disulfide reductase family protein [Bacteroidales bacterium]|nr:TlpA disulfide reductase family protein [Bacteroidales bacterium]